MEQKSLYGQQGYPGPPGMAMQQAYGGGGNPMQGGGPQQGGGFGPMLSQMGQGQGGFPGMGGPMVGPMGHPRAGMMRPRMISASKPMRLQLQQRLQGQQVGPPDTASQGTHANQGWPIRAGQSGLPLTIGFILIHLNCEYSSKNAYNSFR